MFGIGSFGGFCGAWTASTRNADAFAVSNAAAFIVTITDSGNEDARDANAVSDSFTDTAPA